MDFLGFVIDFIVDFMTQEAVDGFLDDKKRNIRYAVFTVLMFIAVIVLFVLCWKCYKKNEIGFVVGFGILELLVAFFWGLVAIRKNRKKKK